MAKDIIPWRKRDEKADVTRRGEDPFLELRRSMDELFDEFFEGFGRRARWPALSRREPVAMSPDIDVSETDDEVQVKVDLPGLDQKDVQLTLDNDLLTIRGEKRQEREEKKRNYHLVERSYGQFQRSVPVPSGIDSGRVKASFKHGVLTVTLPKTQESKSRQKTIDISTE